MLIYLSAGELSGDHLGASVATALKALEPEIQLQGYGGPEMEQAGVHILYPLPSLAIMGFVRVIKHIPTLRKLLRKTERYLAETRPDAVVLIDYPGWHFVVARAARRLGIPVVQFVAPQVWAWAPWRIRKIQRRIDRLLVVLPFEEVYFRDRGVEARYVGHPLIERLARAEADLPPPTPDSPPMVGILPGSRIQEWRRLLPVFTEVFESLRKDRPHLTARVACASKDFRSDMEALVQRCASCARVEVDATHRIQRDATLVLTSSGTSTLECTYFRTPMVVAYPVGVLAGLGARIMVTAPYITLANLLAGRDVVPEFLFTGRIAPRIAVAAAEILDNPARRAAIVDGLDHVRSSLVGTDPSVSAAKEILDLVASPDLTSRTARQTPGSRAAPPRP